MSKWETIGYIGVDSGTIMVVDPCYVIPDEGWPEWCNHFQQHEYLRACETEEGGIAVTTAHGDGQYAVEAKYEGDIITEIRIKFV